MVIAGKEYSIPTDISMEDLAHEFTPEELSEESSVRFEMNDGNLYVIMNILNYLKVRIVASENADIYGDTVYNLKPIICW